MEKDGVLNHLMFHKALISDNEEDGRIDRYLRIMNEMENGLIIGIRDPMEKSIATIFELVIEQKFDPWDINIAEFTKMYLKRVKKEDHVNFVTAGRLILMAWSVLKLQSDRLLLEAQPPVPEERQDWMDEMDIYDSPEDFDFTNSVVRNETAPIQEIMRTPPSRPVTLIELVNAFDDALSDASKVRKRDDNAKRIKAPNFHQNVHKENLNEDLELTWNRILGFNGKAIPIHNIWMSDKWDRVTVFVAVMFLARMNKVKLWQRNFPYGEIFVKCLNHSKGLSFEELILINAEKKSMEEEVEA
ncbi:MAG: hypothetical protein KAI64_03620 [Thermoplasmata archaeon]|nr:hypothetical protein [Thermoplasmata archaeon]